MPVNKNAYIRYRTLDRCFRNKQRRYFIQDLIDACTEALVDANFDGSVSRRQIFDDISFMESDAGFSIELDRHREGKKVYYRYHDTDFSISQQPISKGEAQQLQQAIVTLTRFRGLPQYEWIEEVISNLELRFNLGGKSAGVVCFDQNRDLKGLEYLGPLIDAATEHKVLKVNYHNYKRGGRDMVFIFHPYYLKQYNNRWFAFGRNDATGQIANLALDRIEGLETKDEIEYIINTEIDFDHHFDNVVGVTIPNNPEGKRIVFRTTPERYSYIWSKPLHPSQRIVDRKQCMLSIDVAPNPELEQKLLSFGPDVEVLEPEYLREHIKKKVEESYKKYFSVQNDRTGIALL